ncbi:tyrosine kinase receptor Cad96Ca [Lycorma delicatula]|uniref:tyrosine kinase receptor Cad96Ca n=1 Tax=Lycorma delicatula TaxID=130591 RepID=UPI003F50ECBC
MITDKTMFWTVYIYVFINLYTIGTGQQISDNTPPVVWLDRNWIVADTEEVGAVVTRVRSEDAEGDPLEYGLEHHTGFNIANTVQDEKPLPFRIDNRTGVVYTNESLINRGGEDLFLYVTVSDGKLTHKSEVWVNILNTSNLQSNPRKPSKLPPSNPPQYHSPPQLPGNNNNRRNNIPYHLLPQGFPQQPRLPPPTPPTLLTSSTTQETTSLINSEPTLTWTNQRVNNSSARLNASTTNDINDREELSSTLPSHTVATDIAFVIVPVVMVAIILSVSAIAACIFRKQLCKKAKTKKDEMRKEPASGGEEPMAMHHWGGPRAFINRYESWNTENSDNQNEGHTKLSDRWEFPRYHLKVFNILGEGCFGQVWRCEAMNIDGVEGTSVVAVKTLKENAGERERSDLLQELEVMKSLEPHPHVVRLLGCCTEKDPIFVIMEFISKGKLQSFLRSSRAQRCYDNMHGKSATLTSRDLTSFCYQVARGMEFLSSKGIIHRDLAARNVLVDENHICKVADFGFARDIMASYVYERKSEGRLPIRWMAPESLYDNIFSVKSDIWSFGVLIWEIVTLGSTPYPGLAAAEVMRKVRDGYRLDKPEHCRRELYNIMFYCWDKDPKERPNFTELVELLEQLLLTETEYIELDRFPDHSYYNMVSLSGEKL